MGRGGDVVLLLRVHPDHQGAVVGQGTMGGALVSQAVLDDGTKKHFVPGNEDELN